MGKDKVKKPRRDKKKVSPNQFDEIDQHLVNDGYEMDSIDEAKKANKSVYSWIHITTKFKIRHNVYDNQCADLAYPSYKGSHTQNRYAVFTNQNVLFIHKSLLFCLSDFFAHIDYMCDNEAINPCKVSCTLMLVVRYKILYGQGEIRWLFCYHFHQGIEWIFNQL